MENIKGHSISCLHGTAWAGPSALSHQMDHSNFSVKNCSFFTWLSPRVWSRSKFILGFKLHRSSYNRHVVNLCFVADSYNTLVHQNQYYSKVCPHFFPLVVTENSSSQSPVRHLQHSNFPPSTWQSEPDLLCLFLFSFCTPSMTDRNQLHKINSE